MPTHRHNGMLLKSRFGVTEGRWKLHHRSYSYMILYWLPYCHIRPISEIKQMYENTIFSYNSPAFDTHLKGRHRNLATVFRMNKTRIREKKTEQFAYSVHGT